MPQSPDYFDRFSTAPVEIKDFDPQTRIIAGHVILDLQQALAQFMPLSITHVGSTLWGIAGKNDVEVVIAPADEQWYPVLIHLINTYHHIGNLAEDYARFDMLVDGYKVEIIVLRGRRARMQAELTEFLVFNHRCNQGYRWASLVRA